MCGRFTLSRDPGELRDEVGLGSVTEELHPRFNIAPTQSVAVVTDPVKRDVALFHWGLVPGWAKDISIGNKMINARSETLLEKPSFRNAFARRRCLILSDGFYEWDKKGEKKTPYFIHLADSKAFTFAGLWEVWRSPEGEVLNSCTIITCPANQLVGKLHDRMPVILPAEIRWDWLDTKSQAGVLQKMLVPYPDGEMAMYPVRPLVNNPAYDSPDCMKSL